MKKICYLVVSILFLFPVFKSEAQKNSTLEHGAHGLYTYAIFTHQDTYPGGSVGELRFGAKLSGSVSLWR